MILKVFALYDTKAGMYMQPFFFPSLGQAVRAVSDLAGDMTTLIARHPNDFVLYLLGEFNDASGQFTHDVPEHIGAAAQLMATPPQTQDMFNG